MTYTTHRDTQETLLTLDRLDLDTDRPTEEEIMKKFGLEERFRSDELTLWERVKPRVWALFDEPYSSQNAKVFFPFAATYNRVYVHIGVPFSCSNMERYIKFPTGLQHRHTDYRLRDYLQDRVLGLKTPALSSSSNVSYDICDGG